MPQSTSQNISDWVKLVQSEFGEMPGLHLSRQQAQRLWNLDVRSMDVILDTLVSSHFLRRAPGDVYMRADIGC